MKTLKTILCAVALATIFVTAKADFVLNVNGTAEIEKSYSQDDSKTATTANLSFNNKFVYTLISNAVAGTATWAGTNIASTNLPADGYIAFNPTAVTNSISGIFYVTNKSGLYYPLSGFDANGQYYSWIELDSEDDYYGFGNEGGFRLGWVNAYLYFDAKPGLASYHLNSQAKGTQTLTTTGVLFIHDNPYCYDDMDTTDNLFYNYLDQGNGDNSDDFEANAIEIRGILTATLATDDNDSTISGISLTGPGNLVYKANPIYFYNEYALVKTATVTFGK